MASEGGREEERPTSERSHREGGGRGSSEKEGEGREDGGEGREGREEMDVEGKAKR